MNAALNGEVAALLAMTLCGAGISLLFDFLRSVRRVIRFGGVAAAVSDLLFWIAVCGSVAACIWIFNDGRLRFFEFAGLFSGAALYFCILSGAAVRFFTYIIELILKIFRLICKILLTPLKFLYKILIVPVMGLIKKLRNKIREKGLKDDGTKVGRKNKKVSPESDGVYNGSSERDKNMGVRSDNRGTAVQGYHSAASDRGKQKADTDHQGTNRIREAQAAGDRGAENEGKHRRVHRKNGKRKARTGKKQREDFC